MGARGVRCGAMATAVLLTLIGSRGGGLQATQIISQTWADQDIGNPAVTGSAVATPSGFTITAGGAGIGGYSDQFHFVYQQVSGDVDVRARIDSLTYAASWSKAGVMIRGSLAADAPHGLALVSAGKGTWFQRRKMAGGPSSRTAGPAVAAPEWVRLIRRGTTISSYASPDGTHWSFIASDTIALPSVVYVGLAVTSQNASAATTASLSQIGLSGIGLPPGQADGDIGSPAIVGFASYAAGAYQIHAGGADIAGTADQFHFVYQPVTGDVDVAVRVASISYVNNGTKAGLMIRESLTAGSPHGYAILSAGKGYAFRRRPVAGGTSVTTAWTSGAAPGWVRLRRSGSLLTAYQSADGKMWTALGSDQVPMADTVYVGIAVTSHSTTAATDVTADSLTIAQGGPVNQPPIVSIASPAAGASFTAPASIAITANASDPENQLARVDFYNGSALLGTATAAPYSFTWSSVPAGTYALTAVAYDAGGLSATSTAVGITVTTATVTVPTGVVFTASIDNATVTSYRLDVFAAGADPTTATPVATLDAGKPTPDVNNDITVSAPSFFSALAPGSYQLTVSAISPGGSGRSAPIAFTR